MIGEEALGQLSLAEAVDTAGVSASARFDWFATVISQYANSPVLLSLIENFADYVDPSANIDLFFRLMFDVDTAAGYGLDCWGRIVGVSRVLQLTAPGTYFGFSESSDAHSFNEGVFYGGLTLTDNFALSNDSYRKLIMAKALANICDSSIPAINQILINLFGSTYGNCYVTDNGGMTMTYTFNGTLSPVDYAIVAQSGVLPRPAGVSATIVQV